MTLFHYLKKDNKLRIEESYFNIMGFPDDSGVKNQPANAGGSGDRGSIPVGRSPGEGNGNLFQYSCLGNPMDRGASWAIVHGIARVRHNLVTKQ